MYVNITILQTIFICKVNRKNSFYIVYFTIFTNIFIKSNLIN